MMTSYALLGAATDTPIKKGMQLGLLIALAIGGAYAGYALGRR